MKVKERLKIISAAIAAVILAVLLIADSKGVSEAVSLCVETCTNTLIPSLFGYMVLSTFLIQSGLGSIIFTPLWYVFRKIIRLDKKLFSIFMLSQIGGYPVGVKLINTITQQVEGCGNIKDRAVLFCYGSGPAFVTGLVGQKIYGSITAGMIIFVSCILANFIIAAVITRKSKPQSSGEEKPDVSADTAASSIMSSAKALLVVCTTMIMFNIITELFNMLLSEYIPDSMITSIIKSVWEITNIKCLDATLPLPIAAALISFGGICVIFQIISIADFKINLPRYIGYRAFSALLSALICFIIVKLSGFEPAVSTLAYGKTELLINNPVVFICTAIMTGFLMSLIYKSLSENKKF